MNNQIILDQFATTVKLVVNQGYCSLGETCSPSGGSCSRLCGLATVSFGQQRWICHKAKDTDASGPLICSGPFHGPVPNFVFIILCFFSLKLLLSCKL